MSTILLYDSLQATPPLVDTAINEICDSTRHSSTIAYYYYSTVFLLKQAVIHKYITKYQQNHNQTILA